MGGVLHVYKRENSNFWQCSAFLNGRNHRVSTKTDSLAHAKDFAEDWYLELKGKVRRGEAPGGGVTFNKAADQFLHEFLALTAGERSPIYVKGHQDRLRVHLRPFFGKKGLAEITPGLVQEYRIHRMTSRKDPKTGEPLRPAKNTLHQEIVCLRQVLKCANRHGWIPYLPDLSTPFRSSGKISHRGWFSLDEYNKLWRATQRRAKNPPKPRWRRSCEQLHDYVLFMANTGLRPDESARLQFRDVTIVAGRRDRTSASSKSKCAASAAPATVRVCRARFSRSSGCATGRAPSAGEEGDEPRSGRSETPAQKMEKPKPTDLLFDMTHRELFKQVLQEEELQFDREGQRRTAYSLRHTYICLRLMEGADIYQIAKNCRTSVEMIEKYYASHIKTSLDAAAINVRKSRMAPLMKDRPKSKEPPKGRGRRT